MAPTDTVRARTLEVGYGAAPVCAPVSFALRPGKAVALVGPNGSGKSTVLRAVLGLLAPMSGTVTVLGEPVDERRATFRRAVASVLDDDAWFPALTVAEHLDLVARGHGVAEADAVVDELLEDFGLWDEAASLPTALSSGQRRRLLLASAFARPRALLVLDEPEQRLDSSMKEALAERLLAEKASGVAVLMATHDPDLVSAVADRAVLVGEEESPVLSPTQAVAALRSTPA
ncbi:ABC transporter ATP-binding protein [Actinotalea fermentans]|uniref:ABC transporter ATP-binding protein n=1 Tax=Actinotalea fermentans TaxID=43671 RepID=UPI00051F472F|nr:ABC transporter ATP-binding protein [Actinotalea fermentans]KGM15600.1 ABC transporter [Actinotalea fermentans ATCC 43279 = JCM 9966 = DSM 3133]